MHEVRVTTFGYLHDPAPEAHITVDLRKHFRDPHVRPELRYLTARDTAVYDAVRAYLAGPASEPVTLAVGCAGGRHRAAYVGELASTILAEERPARRLGAGFSGRKLIFVSVR